MILASEKINEEILNGRIKMFPYSQEQLGPNSYNITLSNDIIRLDSDLIDLEFIQETVKYSRLPSYYEDHYYDYIILEPNELYLGCSREYFGSDHYVPIYEGRSSLARIGFESHLCAGFCDLGWEGQLTFEIRVAKRVKIPLHILDEGRLQIGQVYFSTTDGKPISSYKKTGQYNGQTGPTPVKKIIY